MNQRESSSAETANQGGIPTVPFEKACDFVIELGEDAHGYGSSSPRLESFLTSLMRSFGYIGAVISTPNNITFALQEAEDKPQRFHLITSLHTGLDLDKLSRVGDLIMGVINGKTTIDEAIVQLKAIKKIPAPWGMLPSAISYAATGAGIAGVLMGSWWDIAVSIVLSLLVYAMVVYSSRIGPWGANWLPLLSAFMVGGLAAFAKVLIPELNIVLIVISAIAVLLPGYTISNGAMELVQGHVNSGTINIINGIVYLLKQVVGAWIGVKMVTSLTNFTTPPGPAPDIYWQWLFVPVLAVGLCLSFQTSKRDFLWAILACMIAYLGSWIGGSVFGTSEGTLLGTVALVVFSNNWTTKTSRPTSIVLVPGIVMLVSGFAGFKGFVALAAGEIQQGESQIQHMFFVALTIAAGLVVGNTISRPKVTL